MSSCRRLTGRLQACHLPLAVPLFDFGKCIVEQLLPLASTETRPAASGTGSASSVDLWCHPAVAAAQRTAWDVLRAKLESARYDRVRAALGAVGEGLLGGYAWVPPPRPEDPAVAAEEGGAAVGAPSGGAARGGRGGAGGGRGRRGGRARGRGGHRR